MKSSMQDTAKGSYHEAKGKVKDMAGEITNDPRLEAEGKDERIAGKVQKRLGQTNRLFRSSQ